MADRGEETVRFYMLRDWIIGKTGINKRLRIIFLWYLLSLMVETRKNSLSFAAVLSGLNKSQFSKFLRNNRKTVAYTLGSLSKKKAKALAKLLVALVGLPWAVAIIIDSTFQARASLKSENVQKFTHGKGFVIGHQWTNIVLFINGFIIPLPPIPFYTKKYCRENKIKYRTEHDRIVEYLTGLNLAEYIGPHRNDDVVVLADSGYDCKTIQNTIIGKGWDFIIALKKKRGVKSEAKYAKTRKSEGWEQIGVFFRNQRKLPWETVRILTDGLKRKRTEFRIRHTEAWLNSVGKVRLVCSEFKKRRKGKRKYFACTDLKITPRQILIAYRLRWKIEIFHKHVKMHLGFEDVAAKNFRSVESHVYAVYCAYILMHDSPPGVSGDSKTILEKQQDIKNVIENKKIASVLQGLTQIGGEERYKNKLKSVLADVESPDVLFDNIPEVR
ncbi:MAG: transposase [Desulfobacteraceae bacterium]|nr:transposase [Desulfobacteraceae bacterium]